MLEPVRRSSSGHDGGGRNLGAGQTVTRKLEEIATALRETIGVFATQLDALMSAKPAKITLELSAEPSSCWLGMPKAASRCH